MNKFILEGIIFLTGLFALFLAIFVYSKNPRNSINKNFSILSLLFSLWIFSNFFSGIMRNPIWPRIFYAIGSLIPCSVLIFILEYCQIKVSKTKKFIFWIIGFIFFILSFTTFFIKEISSVRLGSFEGIYGKGFYFWCVYLFIFISYSAFIFIKTYREYYGLKKLQIKYIAFGFISTGIFVIVVDIILPLLGNKDLMVLDSPASLFYLICTAYAIVKYQLMDIKVVLTRTSIFVLVYSLVLGLPFLLLTLGKNYLISILGENWWLAPLILLGVLATFGPF
ncbi:MAG: hypothetical protein N2Z79_04385, partial [Candidatus Omnitrophica bacterium]|nr:hypothetical protein [Candidatus Omnitrophota bacterium]